MIGDSAEFANSITFPYLSVHGTSYTDSLDESFKVLANSGCQRYHLFQGLIL